MLHFQEKCIFTPDAKIHKMVFKEYQTLRDVDYRNV